MSFLADCYTENVMMDSSPTKARHSRHVGGCLAASHRVTPTHVALTVANSASSLVPRPAFCHVVGKD